MVIGLILGVLAGAGISSLDHDRVSGGCSKAMWNCSATYICMVVGGLIGTVLAYVVQLPS